MKKYLKSIATLALMLGVVQTSLSAAEINTPLFATFDDGNASPFVLNGDGAGADIKTQSVAINPSTIKNTTSNAIRVDLPADVQWWHKTYLKIEDGSKIVQASAAHKYLHIFVMYPEEGNGMEIGIFNQEGTLIYQKGINFEASTAWQDMVFDLTTDLDGKPGIAGQNIGGMWIRPYTGGGKTMYVDQFELSDNASPRSASPWNSPTLATFEDDFVSPFTISQDGGAQSIISNTQQTGINTSSKALLADYAGGSEWWHKVKLESKSDYIVLPQSDAHKYLHFMSNRSRADQFVVEIYTKTDVLIYKVHHTPTLVDEWEEIILDLTQSEESKPGIIGQNIGKIWIYSYAGGGAAASYQYDNFVLSDTDTPIPTGIENQQADNLDIQTDGQTIIINSANMQTASLYSLSGQLLDTKQGDDIRFENLTRGLYIVKIVMADGSVSTAKVVL